MNPLGGLKVGWRALMMFLSLIENNPFLTKMFSTAFRLQLRCNWDFLIKKIYIGDSHLNRLVYIIGK
jgi:hypothetical protein